MTSTERGPSCPTIRSVDDRPVLSDRPILPKQSPREAHRERQRDRDADPLYDAVAWAHDVAGEVRHQTARRGRRSRCGQGQVPQAGLGSQAGREREEARRRAEMAGDRGEIVGVVRPRLALDGFTGHRPVGHAIASQEAGSADRDPRRAEEGGALSGAAEASLERGGEADRAEAECPEARGHHDRCLCVGRGEPADVLVREGVARLTPAGSDPRGREQDRPEEATRLEEAVTERWHRRHRSHGSDGGAAGVSDRGRIRSCGHVTS